MKRINPWLAYLMDDFEALQVLINTNSTSSICFHAQQVVEKSLKAILFDEEKNIPKTHDLVELNKKINFPLSIAKDDLEFLSDVYIESRYPGEIGLLPYGNPTKEDSGRAYKIATEVYDILITRLKT